MKLTEQLRRRVERLLSSPGEELGRWAKFARFQLQLWKFCARRLHEVNATAMSAALSFRTVFAMVPILVLAGLALKTGGALEQAKGKLRQYVIDRGFAHITRVDPGATTRAASEPTSRPAKVVNLADRIERTIERAERKLTFGTVGPVGIVLLIWSALTLATTLERSLNRIFGAPRSRPPIRRVCLYWSTLTLGAVVLAAAVYLGGRATKAFANVPGVSWILAGVGWAGPVILGILFVAALYKFLPNTSVSFRLAAGGALVAVPLWLVAKWAFGLYVRALIGRPSIYGALGLAPLFLLWLNFSWLIFLFGAQLAHTAANLGQMRSAELAERTTLGPWELLAAAVAVGRSYLEGSGPMSLKQVADRLRLPDASVQQLLDRLASAGIIYPVKSTQASAYVLARPAEKIPVFQFLVPGTGPVQSITAGAPEQAVLSLGPGHDQDIADSVASLQQRTQDALRNVTLADLLGRRQGD
jgi:membrane protein